MALFSPNKPSLPELCAELIEMIAESLDLATKCSLRLTCRTLSQLSSGPHFMSFFSHQQTDLSPRSLQRLCNIASHLQIRPAVQSLAVLAVIYDTSELDRMLKTKKRRVLENKGGISRTTDHKATKDELDEAWRAREQFLTQQADQEWLMENGSDVQLLADALRRLCKLKTLSVEISIDQGFGKCVAAAPTREWSSVWVRATQVYRIMTLALAHSGVAVETLQIYKGSNKYSLPTLDINQHMPALESKTFARAAQHIKSLTLSVSTKLITNHEKIVKAGMGLLLDRLYENNPIVVAAENYPGVARLLKQMPNLEHLDLHLYAPLENTTKNYGQVLSCIANSVVLPSLRHCTLRGLPCDEASLLRFLRLQNALNTLELCEVILVSGSWNPVFSQLCTMPSLQQVTLSSIRTLGKFGRMNLTSHLHSKEEKDAMITGGESCVSFRYQGVVLVHTRFIPRDQMLKERFVFEDWARID